MATTPSAPPAPSFASTSTSTTTPADSLTIDRKGKGRAHPHPHPHDLDSHYPPARESERWTAATLWRESRVRAKNDRASWDYGELGGARRDEAFQP